MWQAYRLKRGSLFIGRRVEQAVGNLMAFYISANSKNSDINPLSCMPHEDMPATSFEEERLKAIRKKSA